MSLCSIFESLKPLGDSSAMLFPVTNDIVFILFIKRLKFKLSHKGLATLLGRVNKQNSKAELKTLFLFFLAVLFCCDVGVSGLELKATSWGSYKLLNFRSKNSYVILSISVRKIHNSIEAIIRLTIIHHTLKY